LLPGSEGASRPKRMSPDRDVIACPLPRLPELGAMASVFSALASEAVCLTAFRILAGRDRGDERQTHNDNLGHRCQLSVYENVGDLGKKAERNPGCRATSGATRVLSVRFYPLGRSRVTLRCQISSPLIRVSKFGSTGVASQPSACGVSCAQYCERTYGALTIRLSTNACKSPSETLCP
jgi:hypothetical protein